MASVTIQLHPATFDAIALNVSKDYGDTLNAWCNNTNNLDIACQEESVTHHREEGKQITHMTVTDTDGVRISIHRATL